MNPRVADLENQDDISFYWINGSFEGADIQVAFNASVDGSPVSATARFKVHRPRMDSFIGAWTTDNPKVQVGDPGSGRTELHLGSEGSRGITFTASVTMPQGFGGELQIVQLVRAVRFEGNTLGTYTYTKNTEGHGNVLDALNPPGEWSDSPGMVLLHPPYTIATANDEFEDYLMFKPSDGIWVGLGRLTWSWSGSANFGAATQTWRLDPSAKPLDNETNRKGVDSTDQPYWDTNIANVPSVTKTP